MCPSLRSSFRLVAVAGVVGVVAGAAPLAAYQKDNATLTSTQPSATFGNDLAARNAKVDADADAWNNSGRYVLGVGVGAAVVGVAAGVAGVVWGVTSE